MINYIRNNKKVIINIIVLTILVLIYKLVKNVYDDKCKQEIAINYSQVIESRVQKGKQIGNKVYIGSNASILPKVSVASDCNIFSNATVIQNLATKSFIIEKRSLKFG